MKTNIQKQEILKSKLNEISTLVKKEKEIAKLAKTNSKLAKNELVSEFDSDFKNPFKLFNSYVKNIDLIRVKELSPCLPLLSKDEFFELFDNAKKSKKIAKIASFEYRKELALLDNDLTKANSIDKAIIKAKQKPVSEFQLPFTLNTLLSLVR